MPSSLLDHLYMTNFTKLNRIVAKFRLAKCVAMYHQPLFQASLTRVHFNYLKWRVEN